MREITAPKTEGRVSIIRRALKRYNDSKTMRVSNVDYIAEMRKIPAMKKKQQHQRLRGEKISHGISSFVRYQPILEL